MFTVFKTFSWTALISALGYAFVDSPEMLYLMINPNANQPQVNAYKAVFDELVLHDQILVQRLVLKTQVFDAFKSNACPNQNNCSFNKPFGASCLREEFCKGCKEIPNDQTDE